MDMTAINTAIAGLTMGNTTQTSGGQGDGTDISGISFAEILGTLAGGDTSNAYAALGTMDAQSMMYAALLGFNNNNASWQSIQNQMLTDAMQALLDSEKPVVTDPVLAQLLQMLKSLTGSEDAEGSNEAELLDVITKMQKRLQEMVQDNGAEVAGQQLLAMMSVLPGGSELVGNTKSLPAEANTALLNLALTSQPSDLLALLTGGETPRQLAQAMQTERVPLAGETPQATTTAGQPTPQTTANPQATTTAVQQPLAKDAELLEAPTPQAQPATVAEGDARFAGMVRSVREQLAQTPTPKAESEAPKADIDTLQQQVDSGVYLKNTAMAAPQTISLEQVPEEQPVPVTTQLTEGLKTALEAGNEQLTIKLKPEELGEVTMRLTKTAGGMSLELFAKNPDTQRLLESQIDLLRDNLRPMRVDVQSVMNDDQFTSLSWQQQGFAGRQQNWNEMHGAAYYGDEPLGSTAAQGVEAAMMAAAAPSSMLDTYI